MLWTFVNDPTSRSQALTDFINDFPLPKFTVWNPIILLRKIMMQNVASRARAILALQPITWKDAKSLDHKITAKVHDCLGFPFRPNSDLLGLPIKLMVFEFPSISKINTSIAIEGLAHDLNHHIKPYQVMARIMLAECENPIDIPSNRSYSRLSKKLPVAWIEAQSSL